MSHPRSKHISARIRPDQAEVYRDVAQRLGVSLSELVVLHLDEVAGVLQAQQWETRRVHLWDGEIVAIGECAPLSESGVALPTESYLLVAPRRFWERWQGSPR